MSLFPLLGSPGAITELIAMRKVAGHIVQWDTLGFSGSSGLVEVADTDQLDGRIIMVVTTMVITTAGA